MSDAPRTLADRGVEVLAAVASMRSGVQLEHPERHIVRELHGAAVSILEQAFSQASRLVEVSADLQKTHRGIEANSASLKDGGFNE